MERSDFELDLVEVFDNWQHGSVIRSWLVGLMGNALRETGDLDELSTLVEDTGEVKWMLDWALSRDIPTPVTSDSQQALMQYRDRRMAASEGSRIASEPVRGPSGAPEVVATRTRDLRPLHRRGVDRPRRNR